MYLNAKVDRFIEHEWINFPELECITPEKDKQKSLHVNRIVLNRNKIIYYFLDLL
jgi:hypothetical protein